MQVVYIQEGADLDALSSAFGLTIINKHLKIVLPHSLSSSAKKAVEEFKDLLQEKTISKEELNWNRIKRLYLTDSHSVPKDYTGKVIVYDHHPLSNKVDGVKLHVEEVGACTTLVVELIKKRRKKLSARQATLISLGIYEDTGSFRFPSTTGRDIRALEYLSKFGLDFNTIREIVEDRFDSEDVAVLNQLIKNIQTIETANKKISITSYNDRYSKDVSRLLKYLKDFEKLDGYFVVVGQKNKVSVIGRSRSKELDVAKVLSIFDGGGHWYAASAKVKGFSVGEIIDLLKFVLSEKKAKVIEFMDSDIPVLSDSSKIIDISKLPHFPIYLVVNQEGKFQGGIKDKTVRDLIKHGLGEERVIDYTQDVITVGLDWYIFEIVKIFKTTDQEIFPVVDRGKLVGIVSRRELSKKLFKQEYHFSLKSPIKKRNISMILSKSFPPEIIQELRDIGKVAREIGCRAFIVGGVVRDILMGRKNLDIDILVEGDATNLLREYGKLKKFSYFTYPEFLTGYVKIPNGVKIDFATARREVYDYPGAYPRIEITDVREDLLRRDFSINTLIVEITEGSFGILYDYFGGTIDIKEKRIRVLHPVSFVEDPIRILRAVRFAGRFGFKLDKESEKLLRSAVKNNLLNFAPPGRVKLELELTFNEERVLEILSLMEDYRILNSILEIDTIPNPILYRLQKVKDMVVMFREFFSVEPSKTFVYLITLLSSKPAEKSYLILKNYHFDREAKYLQKILWYVLKLAEGFSPEVVLQLLKEPMDILITVAVLSEDSITSKIVEMCKKSKNPLITGRDLIELGLKPSNIFKSILEDVNIRYIQGKLKTKEDGIKYIKEEYLKQVRDEDISSRRQSGPK